MRHIAMAAATACAARRQSVLRLLTVAAAVLALGACTATRSFNAPTAPTAGLDSEATVLFMAPDVELGELGASGMVEVRADWTSAATTNVTNALRGAIEKRGDRPVIYQPPADGSAEAALHTQIIKLHGAVGTSILLHKIGRLPLPGKKNKFDWTLGPDVQALHDYSTADYALFVRMEDSYSSGGRVALQIFGALLGVGIPGGQQVGFASLVDLKTGNVVWFNFLHSTVGDLRTADGAADSIDSLLDGYPM